MLNYVLLSNLLPQDLADDAFLNFLEDARDNTVIQEARTPLALAKREHFSPMAWSAFSKTLLTLQRYRRILRCPDINPNCKTLGNNPCLKEIAIADIILGGSNAPSLPKTIPLSTYSSNRKVRRTLRRIDISLSEDVPASYFEQAYLSKYFRFCARLVLVDRTLGNFWRSNPNYEATLNWIVATARNNGVQDIELKTAFQPKKLVNEPYVHAWCDSKSVILSTYVYRNLPHWRALVTDRFSLKIDVGFDLLRPAGMVRSTEISVKPIGHNLLREYKDSSRAHKNPACPHC